MAFSAKAEYACLAVIDLVQHQAASDGPIQIKDICKRKKIPYKYLTQILPQLKSIGIVQSVRGTSGGYLLTRAPEQLTLLELIEAVDGPLENHRREKGLALMPSDPRSVLSESWRAAMGRAREELSETTVRDVIDRLKPPPLSYSI
jgi:Rrf2 family protein